MPTPQAINTPKGPPSQWLPPHPELPENQKKAYDEGQQKLLGYAKGAMNIEFHTIPLYLYAAYSIIRDNGGPGTKARYSLLGVVEQEMLHLTLAGNIMRALGGSQKLYSKDFVPVFDEGTLLLYDEINLNLEPAEKPLLETFIKIEAPYAPPNPELKPETAETFYVNIVRVAEEYHSIGQFYHDFNQGLEEVCAVFPDILNHNTDVQFSGNDAFPEDMTVVKNLESAQKAMKVIVDQGEGSVGVKECHYNVFLDLYSKRDQWDCYPVKKNPTAEDFKATNEYAYKLARAFDATYCYLLQTIDRIWETPATAEHSVLRHYLVRSIHAIMMDLLTPIADILVQQPLDPTSPHPQHASPCFGFYGTPQGTPYNPAELFEAMKKELVGALDTPGGKAGGHRAKVEAITYSMDKLPPNPPVIKEPRV